MVTRQTGVTDTTQDLAFFFHFYLLTYKALFLSMKGTGVKYKISLSLVLHIKKEYLSNSTVLILCAALCNIVVQSFSVMILFIPTLFEVLMEYP